MGPRYGPSAVGTGSADSGAATVALPVEAEPNHWEVDLLDLAPHLQFQLDRGGVPAD